MQGIFQGVITNMQQFAIPIGIIGLMMLGLTYMAASANANLIREHRGAIKFFVFGVIIVMLAPWVVPALFGGGGGL